MPKYICIQLKQTPPDNLHNDHEKYIDFIISNFQNGNFGFPAFAIIEDSEDKILDKLRTVGGARTPRAIVEYNELDDNKIEICSIRDVGWGIKYLYPKNVIVELDKTSGFNHGKISPIAVREYFNKKDPAPTPPEPPASAGLLTRIIGFFKSPPPSSTNRKGNIQEENDDENDDLNL